MIVHRAVRTVEQRRLRRLRADSVAAARRAHPEAAGDFADLYPTALVLLHDAGRAPEPAVRLLLPTARRRFFFAGMRTAVIFAARYAERRSLPLDIRYLDLPMSPGDDDALRTLVLGESGIEADDLSISSVWQRRPTNEEDRYIVTFWETALAAMVACEAGRLAASRVIYLVQDYEPEFYPGSTESALARATYQAGFAMVINSAPLHAYLVNREGDRLQIAGVFRPELDLKRLNTAAQQRKPGAGVRVGFYARPNNPRNSFELGAAALRIAERLLKQQGFQATFVTVGDAHRPVSLSQGPIRAVGKLPWDAYFDLLAELDVLVSLQQTPHPSHPPLDMVASGGFAVMNETDGSRSTMSDRLLTAAADPRLLAQRVLTAAERIAEGGLRTSLDQPFVDRLGSPMSQVIDAVASGRDDSLPPS